jgi:hypothetical protein
MTVIYWAVGLIIAIGLILLTRSQFHRPCADNIDRKSKERSGRIDIYSQDMAFELKDLKSGGGVNVKHYYAHWLPPNDQKKHAVVEGSVNKAWKNIYIEFTPASSGFVLINLRSSYYTDIKKHHHDVWVDDCEVEGATIENGGFEMIGQDGKPAYWGWSGSSKRYSIDGSQAHHGKCCVLVWHDIPLIQKIEVRGNERYKISAWFKAYIP